MKALVLSGMLILASTNSFAALPRHLELEPALPIPAYAACLSAIKAWEASTVYLRKRVMAILATAPNNASVFISKAYLVQAPHDLPDLLQEAQLTEKADEIRLTLRQIDAYRDRLCRNI